MPTQSPTARTSTHVACQQCGRTFKKEFGLTVHLRRAHGIRRSMNDVKKNTLEQIIQDHPMQGTDGLVRQYGNRIANVPKRRRKRTITKSVSTIAGNVLRPEKQDNGNETSIGIASMKVYVAVLEEQVRKLSNALAALL